VLYGRLLDNNSHRCESLADLSYPVVLLQGRKRAGDRFIECLRSDLYGVLDISNILHRNCARSENHIQERIIFAFRSLQRASGTGEVRVWTCFTRHPRLSDPQNLLPANPRIWNKERVVPLSPVSNKMNVWQTAPGD
jgi:hypothetical protein